MTVPAYAKTGWVYNGSAWNYYSADGTLAQDQWLKDGDSLFWIQGRRDNACQRVASGWKDLVLV